MVSTFIPKNGIHPKRCCGRCSRGSTTAPSAELSAACDADAASRSVDGALVLSCTFVHFLFSYRLLIAITASRELSSMPLFLGFGIIYLPVDVEVIDPFAPPDYHISLCSGPPRPRLLIHSTSLQLPTPGNLHDAATHKYIGKFVLYTNTFFPWSCGHVHPCPEYPFPCCSHTSCTIPTLHEKYVSNKKWMMT